MGGNTHMVVHPHEDEPIRGDDWRAFRKDAAVGICVGARALAVPDRVCHPPPSWHAWHRADGRCAVTGLTDIALVYPLAVLATRREAGITMAAALKQGRFWAGGWTAASLFIPYAICVEGGSNAIRRTVCSTTGIDESSWQGNVAAAVGTASIVTYLGLQPIEKKLVMDQLLQEPGAGVAAGSRRNPLLAPVQEIYQYAHAHGIRGLYGGAVPLLLRELFYITAITVANPLVTSSIEKRTGGAVGTGWGLLGSFSVGCAAGLSRGGGKACEPALTSTRTHHTHTTHTRAHTRTHTHTQSLARALSLTPSLSHSLTLSLPLSLSQGSSRRLSRH